MPILPLSRWRFLSLPRAERMAHTKEIGETMTTEYQQGTNFVAHEIQRALNLALERIGDSIITESTAAREKKLALAKDALLLLDTTVRKLEGTSIEYPLALELAAALKLSAQALEAIK